MIMAIESSVGRSEHYGSDLHRNFNYALWKASPLSGDLFFASIQKYAVAAKSCRAASERDGGPEYRR